MMYIIYANEKDEWACETYTKNVGSIVCEDINKIDIKSIPDSDIIVGGFPCQSFSLAGKQLGLEDTRGTLFYSMANIIKAKKPKMFLMENVKNLKNHDSGKTYQHMKTILHSLGYNVIEKILNAADYGVPQARERVYFACFRKDLKVGHFEFPSPTYKSVCIKDIVEPEEKTKDFSIVRDDIKITKKNSSENFMFETCPLKPIRVGIINKGGQGERIYDEKGHAITLSAYGGGAAGKTGAYLINGRVRQLSPRECLRVLGFPEWFKFPQGTTVHQSYKQCGNSVAAPVVEKIYEKILEILSSRSARDHSRETQTARKVAVCR